MTSLDLNPPLFRRTSSSVFEVPTPSLRNEPAIVEPKPFKQLKAVDSLSPSVLLNPSFDSMLIDPRSAGMGMREVADLTGPSSDREGPSARAGTVSNEGQKDRSSSTSPPTFLRSQSSRTGQTRRSKTSLFAACQEELEVSRNILLVMKTSASTLSPNLHVPL